MKKWFWSIALLALVLSRPAAADVLVLVHGYLGTANSWVESGVLDRLLRRGYRHLGVLGYSPQGLRFQPLHRGPADNPVYSVNLPSQAPIVIQADWLAAMLREVGRRHPEEAIDLAAHSAGGVAARMALVRHGGLGVQHLITIATPHLGTGRAIQALDATDNRGILGSLKSWFVRRATGDALYATVQQSRGILLDLTPPLPGNLLAEPATAPGDPLYQHHAHRQHLHAGRSLGTTAEPGPEPGPRPGRPGPDLQRGPGPSADASGRRPDR